MEQQPGTISLTEWWNETVFTGKEQFTLNEKGELELNSDKRALATFTPENANILLKTLQEKFTELESKVNELGAEWESAEDKMKLSGKMERLTDHVVHSNAVGDIQAILLRLALWEKGIHSLSEEQAAARLKLVEQAEKLAETENWKDTTQVLRDIAEQWKKLGHVAKGKNDELWNRLENARTKFFDRKRKHQEEQEQELLRNLDLKMEIADKAEKLAASEEWKNASEQFKQLMEQWKETGRTVYEKNEELWNRFVAAKNNFFERKKAHFDVIQKEQEENYAKKLALVEKAEAMKDSQKWQATTNAYAALMEEWKQVGRVPADKSDEVWEKLRAAKDHFFQAKRNHFDVLQISYDENYAIKSSILKRAEALKNSTNWREVSIEMDEMMEEWKKTGPVSREHSDKIWEQFLGARKHFFEKKSAYRDQRKKDAEKYQQIKLDHSRQFLHKLEAEIQDEEERLADFRNGLQDIPVDAKGKEKELREHLQNLISQGETKLIHKREKLESVKKELEQPEKPKADNERKNKKQKPVSEAAAPSSEEVPVVVAEIENNTTDTPEAAAPNEGTDTSGVSVVDNASTEDSDLSAESPD